MASVGFTCHVGRETAFALAKSTAQWLEDKGHRALLLPEQHREIALPSGVDQLDLVVSLGGDGTMLRTVAMVLGTGVPVLGVNFGRFGYLAAVEPDGLRQAIERFLEGDYSLERRMTVDARVGEGQGKPPRVVATGLNDIVLARPSGMHTINANVAISGEQFLSYAADAMIIATPTGSTGYNLSARGPIVSPALRCLVLTPVAPHMLFDRSVVLSTTDEVVIEIQGRCGAELIVDGANFGELEVGEQLVCRVGPEDATLVNFGDRKFETVLKSKFHLWDR